MNKRESAALEYTQLLAKARKEMATVPEECARLANHLIGLLRNGNISAAISFTKELKSLLEVMAREVRSQLEDSARDVEEIVRLRVRVAELERFHTEPGGVKESVH